MADDRNLASAPRRAFGWMVANALLWCAVGATAVVAAQRARGEPPTLADLADDAVERMATLDLSSEQRAALAHLRDEWRQSVLAEEAAWQSRVAAAAAAADRQVESLLTADQARRWRGLALGVASK